MWKVFTVLMIVWAVLKFGFHKGGYIHMILIFSLCVLVVQLVAERKTRFYENSQKRNEKSKS